MIEQVVTLKMNKSSQVTLPVAVKRFLSLGDTATMTARMRNDGVLEISREKSLDEVQKDIFATMSAAERKRVNKRMKEAKKRFPDPQDRIQAEKDWVRLQLSGIELEREAKKYGKY